MTSWDDEYVGDLVDELERLGKVSPDVADEARAAVDEGRHRAALALVLDGIDDVTAGVPAGDDGGGHRKRSESATD